MRVVLSATLVICLALFSGCDEEELQHTLPVTLIRVQSLAVEEGFLPAPRAMDISPKGELFVLDDVGRVNVYGSDGALRRKWWMPEYTVGRPEGIEVLRDGRLAIADTHYHRVIICDQQGIVLRKFGEEGEGPGQFIFPCDVTQDPAGNLYVSEYGGNDRVQKFTEQGEFLTEWGEPGTGPGQFQRASGLDWYKGAIYIADAINNRIQAFTDSGKLIGNVSDAAAAGLDYPYDLRVLANETLLVVEYKSGRVTLLSLAGEVLGRYGATGRGEGQFWTPWGLAATDEGRLVVADTGNRRIVELAL
jgi:DNA-binding beta-propeller fold protein YncE